MININELKEVLKEFKIEIIKGVMEAMEKPKSKRLKIEDHNLRTMTEACEFFNTSRTTIYYWMNEKKLPSLKKGKQLYFRKCDLEDFRDKNFKFNERFQKTHY